MIAPWLMILGGVVLLFLRCLGHSSNPRGAANGWIGQDDVEQLDACRRGGCWHVKGATPAKRYRA